MMTPGKPAVLGKASPGACGKNGGGNPAAGAWQRIRAQGKRAAGFKQALL